MGGSVVVDLGQRKHLGIIDNLYFRVGHKRLLFVEQQERMRAYIKGHPGATLAEITAACHLVCTIATGDITLRRMGLTYKKTLRASEQDREDVAAERRDWKERSRKWNSSQLVFIDESGVTTKMTRLYSWSMRGERAHDTAPHGHWGVRTLIGSIRGDGQTTCMTIDAPTDKDVFLAYVRNVLGP